MRSGHGQQSPSVVGPSGPAGPPRTALAAGVHDGAALLPVLRRHPGGPVAKPALPVGVSASAGAGGAVARGARLARLLELSALQEEGNFRGGWSLVSSSRAAGGAAASSGSWKLASDSGRLSGVVSSLASLRNSKT